MMSDYVISGARKKYSRDYYATKEDIERYNKRIKPTIRIDKHGIRRIGKNIVGMTL